MSQRRKSALSLLIQMAEELFPEPSAKYALTKTKIRALFQLLADNEQAVSRLEQRVAQTRRRAKFKPPAVRAEVERELAEVEADLAVWRPKLKQDRAELVALDQELESVWDVLQRYLPLDPGR